MAKDVIQPIYPGPMPATGGGGNDIPRSSGIGAAMSKLPNMNDIMGIILALQQMEQSRSENQKDREFRSALQDRELTAGAGMRAANEEASRAASALTRYQEDRARRFEEHDLAAIIGANKYSDAQLAAANYNLQQAKLVDPIKLEQLQREAGEYKNTLLRNEAARRDAQFGTAEHAVTSAVLATGDSTETVEKTTAQFQADAMKKLLYRGAMKKEGWMSAESISKAMGDHLAPNVLTQNPDLFIGADGKVSSERLVSGLAFLPELAPDGQSNTVYRTPSGAMKFIQSTAEELRQHTHASLIKQLGADGEASTTQPSRENALQEMVFSARRGELALYSVTRVQDEAREALGSGDIGNTPVGKLYNALLAKTERDIRGNEKSGIQPYGVKYRPTPVDQRQASLISMRDWLKEKGPTGFAQELIRGADQSRNKVESMASVRELHAPADISLRHMAEQKLDTMVKNLSGLEGRQIQYGGAIRLLSDLKATDENKFNAVLKTSPPLKQAWELYNKYGAVGDALFHHIQGSTPVTAQLQSLDDQEKNLVDVISAARTGLSYSTKGMTQDQASEPVRFENFKPRYPIPRGTPPTASQPATFAPPSVAPGGVNRPDTPPQPSTPTPVPLTPMQSEEMNR